MRQSVVYGPLRRESDRRNLIRWSAADRSSDLTGATYFRLTTVAASTCPARRIFFPPLRRRKFFVDVGFFEFLRQQSDVFARRPEVLEPVKVQRSADPEKTPSWRTLGVNYHVLCNAEGWEREDVRNR
jgi:hypothetical protein